MYRLDPRKDMRWERFLGQDGGATAFHSTAWLTALHQTYGYEPVVFTPSPPGEDLVGGVPFCFVRSRLTGNRLVSTPFADHCHPLLAKDQLGPMLRFLEAQKEVCRYVELRAKKDLPQGEQLGGLPCSRVEYFHHQIELSHGIDKIFSKLHKNCIRRKILKSQRQLTYDEGASDNLLQQFYKLLVQNRRKHRVPPQPIKWFRNLLRSFGKDCRIRVAYLDGRPIASIFTIVYQHSMIYKYGGSDVRYNRYGAMPFLLWMAIKNAVELELSVFDLGRSDTDQQGLVQFKDRWGSTRGRATYHRFFEEPADASPRSLNFVRHLVPIMPKFLLIWSGRLLYRHVA